jgi:peptide/nickel transport system permease protein
MTRIILRRLLLGIVTLWAVATVVFLCSLLLPGDAAQAILGSTATPEQLAALREQLGLGDPTWQRYVAWLSGIVRGDLGTSLANGLPVADVLGSSVGNSLVLMVLSAGIALPISLLLGTLGAWGRNGALDKGLSTVVLVVAALPEFVVGFLLLFTFATGALHLLPAVTLLDEGYPLLQQARFLILPVATLVIVMIPYGTRMTRGTMLEVLEGEYVQQARLNGIPEPQVLLRHAIPNSLGPVAQVLALQVAWMMGGAIVVEYLFNFPGVGRALVAAVDGRDLPVIQSLVVLVAAAYVLVNIVADVVMILVNPKLRPKARVA